MGCACHGSRQLNPSVAWPGFTATCRQVSDQDTTSIGMLPCLVLLGQEILFLEQLQSLPAASTQAKLTDNWTGRTTYTVAYVTCPIDILPLHGYACVNNPCRPGPADLTSITRLVAGYIVGILFKNAEIYIIKGHGVVRTLTNGCYPKIL